MQKAAYPPRILIHKEGGRLVAYAPSSYHLLVVWLVPDLASVWGQILL